MVGLSSGCNEILQCKARGLNTRMEQRRHGGLCLSSKSISKPCCILIIFMLLPYERQTCLEINERWQGPTEGV